MWLIDPPFCLEITSVWGRLMTSLDLTEASYLTCIKSWDLLIYYDFGVRFSSGEDSEVL
jgi:hypothetical protein